MVARGDLGIEMPLSQVPLVQKNAMRAWKERRSFFELLAADPKVTDHLSADELKTCFDPAFYLKNVDAIFKRLGLAR